MTTQCLCYEFTVGNKITGHCPIHKTFKDVIHEVILTRITPIDVGELPYIANRLCKEYDDYHKNK